MSAAEELRCEALVEMLVEYFGDELDEDARTTLRGHCAICPNCDNFVRTYQATLALTERVLRRELTDADRRALEARLPRQDRPPRG